MTTISPIRYEVEIQEPLSTPVPMPPSMLSSEALVIWMLRIAMKAPIIAANTAIQTARLVRSELTGAGAAIARGAVCGILRASVDMASPLGVGIGDPRGGKRLVGMVGRQRCDRRNDGHARTQRDRRAA